MKRVFASVVAAAVVIGLGVSVVSPCLAGAGGFPGRILYLRVSDCDGNWAAIMTVDAAFHREGETEPVYTITKSTNGNGFVDFEFDEQILKHGDFAQISLHYGQNLVDRCHWIYWSESARAGIGWVLGTRDSAAPECYDAPLSESSVAFWVKWDQLNDCD